MSDDHSFSRRALLRNALTLATGASLCSGITVDAIPHDDCGLCHTQELGVEAYQISGSSITIDLNRTSALDSIGASVQIRDERLPTPVLVIRLDTSRYLALSNQCTHGRAEVTFNPRKHLLVCTSYSRSTYDIEGDVIKGPARGPLPAYNVHVSSDKLEFTVV